VTLKDKVVLRFCNIILARRDDFSLRISDDNKITKLKLCLIYIDDSYLILVFPLHMFSINNFNVNLFSDTFCEHLFALPCIREEMVFVGGVVFKFHFIQG
jgi:hypothetical protein